MSLTDEQANYFRDMEAVFALPGWRKHIMDSVLTQYEGNIQLLAHGTVTGTDLHNIRGALAVLKSLLDYERLVELEKEQALRVDDEYNEEDLEDASAVI